MAMQVRQNYQAEANRLHKLGIAYKERGQYIKALEFYRQALSIRKELKDRTGEAQTLNNIGVVYGDLGQYTKALDYYQQALVIWKGIKDQKDESLALNNIGIAYKELKQYTKALEFYRQALSIRKELKDRKGEAQTLNLIGVVCDSLEQYVKALEYYRQALLIFKEVKNQKSEGLVLNNIGIVYKELKQYTKALEFYQQALSIRKELKDRKGEAQTLSNIGFVYENLNQYAKALDFYQQALVIDNKLSDSNAITDLLFMSLAFFNLSQYGEAIDLAQQALALSKKYKSRIGESTTRLYLATIRSKLGEASELVKVLKELSSLTIIDAKMVAWAEFYQQESIILKRVNYQGEKIQTSFDLSKKAEEALANLAEYRKAGNQQSEAINLGELGLIYHSLNQYYQALEFYQQALAVYEKINDPVEQGNTLNFIGVTYSRLKQLSKALDSFQKSLGFFRQVGSRAEIATALSNIGYLLEENRQPELAIVFYKQSINVQESIRRGMRKLSLEEQQSYTNFVVDTYRRLANLLLQQGRVMEALQVLDLLKVQELQDFFKDVKGNERTAKGIEMLPEEQQILSHLDTSNLDQYLKSTPVTALVNQLRQTATAQDLRLAAYTDLQARLQNLGKDSALLYPLILKDRIELVIFTHNAPPIHRTTLIDQTKLEQTIQSFRASIQKKDSQDIRQPANQLYNWLIQPIEADLKQANIKTLIYAPDGQMRYVPLTALYDGQQWLVEKYQVNYVTALSLTKLDRRSSQPPRILAGAFTDKDVTVSINGQNFFFEAIPSALTEVKNLTRLFPNTTPLIEKQFNRAAMTPDRINGYSIVHLATHGKLVSGAPEASFILLNNNEYITLREIKDWKLPNVALVVLSACQTALGDKLGNGIEVIGFGYQLQQAQARASIATLWEISDASTRNLMNEFYARLQSEHLSPVEALREAQIALITGKGQTSGNKPRSSVDWPAGQSQTATISRDLSHPYYWAPFILIGNGL
ncbi:MAG: tetratricopeptide repeat protein [Leptolyngbya sp. BL-A-14]